MIKSFNICVVSESDGKTYCWDPVANKVILVETSYAKLKDVPEDVILKLLEMGYNQ